MAAMTPAMPKPPKAGPLASLVLLPFEGGEVLGVLGKLSRRLRGSAHQFDVSAPRGLMFPFQRLQGRC